MIARLLPLLLLTIPSWAAPADCWQLRKLSRADEARACFTRLLDSRNPAEMAEGFWGLGRFEEAGAAFRVAVAQDEKNPDLRVRWGRLLLERFNVSESGQLFQEALELKSNHAGALLGLAVSLSEGFDRRAIDLARKAVESDPKLLEAQELVAALILEDGDYDRAREEADKALALDPNALDAMAVHATIDLLADKPETPWIKKMLDASPAYGRGYARIAHWLVINRRYMEAIELYRKAIAVEPENWAARSELGINLMRVGNDREAKELLEQCYDNGYRNAATSNSLKLLDSLRNYETFRTKRAVLRLHKSEAALLRPYVEREAERAISVFEKKYGVTLPEPVQIEFYPMHEDFAVRTMGMPGLGALGVTFVMSVAMDSPSGRPPGTYHWASTLWHELSHVFTLHLTNHRVSRWFTEGLAVHEETAVNPEWGERVTPQILWALAEKKLLPVSKLDRGFIRPEYPGQIVVSYFQAGRLCDYVNERWGWSKLMEMVQAYTKAEPTVSVIERVLGLKPEEFDEQFFAWLDKQHGASVRGYKDYLKRAPEITKARLEKRHKDALKIAAEIKPLFPDYVEKGNVYEAAALSFIALDDKASAAKELREYVGHGGRNPESLKKLAELEVELGRPAEARAALERVLWIYPVQDEPLHRQLGDLRAEAGDWAGAAEEYAAVVALNPTDPATAHYNLARAKHALNRISEAEEQLLLSLEHAPGFRPAQKLLLEINKELNKQP
jgi:cellulose synthase operon protein C